MNCIGEPFYILYCDSLIKSQPCPGSSYLFAGHHLKRIPVKGLKRISRRKSCHPENHDRQQKHNYCKQNDPFQDPGTYLIFFVHNFPFPRPITYMRDRYSHSILLHAHARNRFAICVHISKAVMASKTITAFERVVLLFDKTFACTNRSARRLCALQCLYAARGLCC